MEETPKFFIGIDVSKPHFDASLLSVIGIHRHPIQTMRFENNLDGLKLFQKWLRKNKVTMDSNSLLVLENTGIYHRLIWSFCGSIKLPIYIGNSAHIKWSFGIARGKNDKIDSIRLCQYSCRHFDEILLSDPLDPVILELGDLFSSRSRLLRQLKGNQVYLKELSLINDSKTQKRLEKTFKTALTGLSQAIVAIEAQINKVIMESETIKNSYTLLRSVPGIGHLTALYLICCTSNFKNYKNGKQLACYAGVVPFEHSSGISIKGRNRVSNMANKELKKMLHLCAMSAIQYYDEFRVYYERKTAEGKHKMSVLNAIKNKIILRAASVIKGQHPYLKIN